MADNLFSNTASSLLNTTITDVDTTIELVSGFGARFPSPSNGKYFLAALEDDQGNYEIVKCTSRSNDLLTVTRGEDNTTAQAFTQNVTRVELRAVAATYEEFVQKSGATMAGDLDFDGNSLIDAVIDGGSTQVLNGEIVNVPVRGDAGVSSNELAVPPGGGRATLGGAEILVSGDDLIQYLATAGVIDFSTATVGVEINDGYLQVSNSGETEYLRISADDAGDIDFSFTGVTDMNLTGANVNLGSGVNLQMNDEVLDQPKIQDYSLTVNSVVATSTTDIDYELGSYVELDMSDDIVNLTVSNPPATGDFGSLRIRIKQDGVGSKTITNWPPGVTWPNGTAPELSFTANAVDFVEMWTADEGTTWYAVFQAAFA